MPFVQRVVEPKFLSRTSLRDENGKPKVSDEELQAVTNCTLSNALRQLASLVLLAEDIFSELTSQLHGISERSKLALTRIQKINDVVEKFDPKKVPVPEGSLTDFAVRKVHYTASLPLQKGLFTPDTRPPCLKDLYEKATTDTLSTSILDQLRKSAQHSPYLLCTPVLTSKRRKLYQKVDVEIETHIPAVVEHLRKWTSKEAIGDVTALPDASIRITNSVTLTPDELSECGSGDEEPIDHRLPSPEEQLRVIASKFPPQLVAIDTSGKFFDRMCSSRKSLLVEHQPGETDTVKRRTRTRKPRDYRPSADKPYLTSRGSGQEHGAGATVALHSLHPSLHRPHTAHLRGRHGVITYQNPPNAREQPKFWSLPKRSTYEQNPSQSLYPIKTTVPGLQFPVQNTPILTGNNESIKISPIDPRNSIPFKSSTPSNKENVDVSSTLLSPGKSTMSNEELYAVIHKSKKKLNLKDSTERAESPALSTISLSPVNSETSLYSKGTQRHPETGYLGEPRSRVSWSPTVTSAPGQMYGGMQRQETCADRYGPIPQTSRRDFKKLLLQHSVKLNTLNPQSKSNKLSAVEQLKISKEKNILPPTNVANRSQVNILDLSGSPKTYTQRKMIKPNPQPASPARTNTLIKDHKNTSKILLSPKSQWRFSSPRSDVLSTPILEADKEDESNSSGEKLETPPKNPPSKTVPIVTNQHFGARRNLIPINENNFEAEDNDADFGRGVFPIDTQFTRTHSLSRAEMLQAKRAEFFNRPPESSPPKFSSFRSPTAAGPSVRSNVSPERGNTSPTTLETAL